jgi:lysophospholipase L1-like esterase
MILAQMKKHLLLLAFLFHGVAFTKAQQSKTDTTALYVNTAIVPVPKLEEDSYNWWGRHAEVLAIKDSIKPEILLIGDSITHFWGGSPQRKYANGELRAPNGPESWNKLFGRYRVLNIGFGWDRTQNVLWRLDHGEIDGINPRLVVINIGTNNTSSTYAAHRNTPSEIVDGIMAIYARVRTKMPHAKIVVMALFPRESDPGNPRRALINQVNGQLKVLADHHSINLLNIGPEMLNPDGTFLPGMMLDFTHPTDRGYQVWADALKPFINAAIK